jgi:hypothetical protein
MEENKNSMDNPEHPTTYALIVEGDTIRDILFNTHFDQAEGGIRGPVIIQPRRIEGQSTVDGFTVEPIENPNRQFTRPTEFGVGLPLTRGRTAEPLRTTPDTFTLRKIHAQAQVEPVTVPIFFRPVVIAPH